MRTGVRRAPVEDDPAASTGRSWRRRSRPSCAPRSRLAARIGSARRPGLRVLDLGAGAGAVGDRRPAGVGGVDGGRQRPPRRDRAGGRGAAARRADRPRRAARRRLPRHRRSSRRRTTSSCSATCCRAEGAARRAAADRPRPCAALAPGGQLIVADYFAATTPQRQPVRAPRWALTMRRLDPSAATRSPTPQVVGWLQDAGLRAIRLHEPIGGQQAYVAELDPPPLRTGGPDDRHRQPPNRSTCSSRGWYVVTMDPSRDVIRDGAVAVRGGEIVAVGKAADLRRRYAAGTTVGGDRFVVTPGMVNTHIHITGEPLTRGYVPDDTPFVENVFEWLCPLYAALRRRTRSACRPARRRRDAALGHDDVPGGGHDPLPRRRGRRPARGRHPRPGRALGVGPPARAGRLPPEHRRGDRSPRSASSTTLPAAPTGASSAWSILVGHTTCSDPLWRAAADLAVEHGVGHVASTCRRRSWTPTASSPSSGSARWSTSPRSACSACSRR